MKPLKQARIINQPKQLGFHLFGKDLKIRQTLNIQLEHQWNISHLVAKAISSSPENFNVHPMISKIIKARGKVIEGEKMDWATAEALAFGTLLLEGNHVRFTGQDVERGTLSQRHAVLHCQDTDKTYTSLNNISPNQQKLVIANSSLAEFSILGFETGYSLENPNTWHYGKHNLADSKCPLVKK